MQALTIRGPFHGPTGYDHHVREFARELDRHGVAIELIDLPAWSPARLPRELLDPWFDKLSAPVDSQTVLHFAMPHQVVRVPRKNNMNFTMFEATRVPARWVDENRKHELVIVPTESSRRAWIESGFPEHRIRLCPLGINPAVYRSAEVPLALRLESGDLVERYRTRLLHVAELSPRKNVIGLLSAWTLATSRADDAVLILKLGCYARGSGERLRLQMREMEKRIGKWVADAAPILVLEEMLADECMPALYGAATHYISLSFGEGWDQAMMEAGASGLKLIAPDHSAYREYLDSRVATMLACREVPVAYDGDPATAALFAGASWWEPNQDAAIAAIRSAIDGKDGAPKSARARILENYTWSQATERLIGIIEELERLRAKIPMFAAPRGNKTAASATRPLEPGAPKEPDRA